MAKKLQEKALPDRIMEYLQEKGSITTLELYSAFKEYKTNSIPSAIQVLRARGHQIVTKPISRTKLGHAIVRYILVKK